MRTWGNPLVLLLGAVFFKQLLWTTLVPVFQTPDEQAHFAQLSYIAERRSLSINPNLNLSTEIATVESILGTKRDRNGNNLYTYHPEFNISYTTGVNGEHEALVSQIPREYRLRMVDSEAALYPPLYYLGALPFYDIAWSGSVIDRLFTARFFSLILAIILAWLTWTIGLVVWEDRRIALSIGMLVGFQPMLSFVQSGVHPDNLLNVITAAIILVSLSVLKHGLTWKKICLLGILLISGLATKVFAALTIPVVLAAVIYRALRRYRLMAIGVGAVIVLAPVAAVLFQLPIPYVARPGITSVLGNLSIAEYLHFRLGKTLFEIWPWYWGVFKWLGVVLPIGVLRVITRITVVCILGLLLWFGSAIWRKKRNFALTALVFFAVSTASYVAYLFVWDYRMMQSTGFSAGLQGRYFFVNIVSQLALFLTGWIFFWPEKIKKFGLITAGALMVVLNLIGWRTVIGGYYQLSPVSSFISQASQYKPVFLKGNWLEIILFISLVSLIVCLLFLSKNLLTLKPKSVF